MADSQVTAAEQQPAARPTLPPTFSNSFWSADYRTGFTSLYDALDASLIQSDELLAQVRRRKDAEESFADSLFPPALRRDGFAADDGGSLRIGFEALLTQSVNEGRARQALADDLQRSILTPFSTWSTSHAGRVRSSRAQVDTALTAWERKRAAVEQAKATYDDACRVSAQLEDELSFSRAQGELGSQRAKLPPRPDEVDDTGAPASAAAAAAAATQGATGVISALGRAFSTRRPVAAPRGHGRRRVPKGDESESGDDDDDKLREEDEDKVGAGQGVFDDDDENEGSAALKEARDKARKVWEERAPEVKRRLNNLLSTVVGPQNLEERLDKALREVAAAEDKYKVGVAELDALRLSLEETLAANFSYVQRLESDRLRAAASVLKQFHASIAALPKLIDGSLERVGQTLELARPENDLKGLIERRRTGPFQPSPVLYTSHYSEPALATFGIDLRKFDETNSERETRPVPPVLEILLREIEKKGEGAEDAERRKAWLYEVPLGAQHALRSILNKPSMLALDDSDLAALLAPFDLPVLCATVKLWLLELEIPVVTYSAYDELRALYPRRTAGEGEVEAGKVADVVGKLPKVHFEVLHALVDHLTRLISTTSTPEPLPTYIHKLSLSLSRPLLRPSVETALTLDDRFPAVFLSTLLSSSSDLFAAAADIAKKHRDERYRPRRQRTKPIDQRVRRSALGLGAQESVDLGRAEEVLKLQQRHKEGAVDAAAAGLSVQTQASVLGVPAAHPEHEGAFAASPMAATDDELLPPAVVSASDADQAAAEDERAAKQASEAHEAHLGSSSSTLAAGGGDSTGPTEEAFVPPSDGPTEEAFTPPSSSAPAVDAAPASAATAGDSQDEPAVPALGSAPAASVSGSTAAAADEPLSSSSSLKRASGTGRLRGARAPRPPSQVSARIAAFEGDGK
ncbi:uncharacterized protein RHOBADRAFT_50496 [Rhodotorula graminis WP1]|uniref:Rho-GAP domain-containing protein n=1 Tax=Rhodotorula graminis (strain WP1) TaxID=578459 RepID=A0A194SBJ8_RHOGW|nr:uncharacterized protein RHOBADRAFT_50496 [Rhodotorula graminis WP1]KPV77972.1 hypothetical protein RHOBADRAFT_50496 [Rhodotorula graminis WP1]